MTETPGFRRGDVVLARVQFTSDPAQAKWRPAVVIQNNVGNRYSANLIVAALSSRIPTRNYPTHVIVRRSDPGAARSGLDRDSVVHADLIMTIGKDSVVRTLGRLDDAVMDAVDTSLRVSLALR